MDSIHRVITEHQLPKAAQVKKAKTLLKLHRNILILHYLNFLHPDFLHSWEIYEFKITNKINIES